MAESWIALKTRSREVGWTSKLKGGPFAAWVKFLMTVKDCGKRGGCICSEYLDSDWLRKNNVTLAHWSTMLAAAIDNRAVKQENGVFTVTKWADYQRDPTNAERQDRWRDRQGEDVVTGSNGDNADRTGQDHTRQDRTRQDTTPSRPIAYTEDFETFWKAYPRRVGKGAAFEVWEKKEHPEVAVVVAAVEAQAKSDQWKKEGGKFIPHPRTWLNQKRWDDDVEPAKPSESGVPQL